MPYTPKKVPKWRKIVQEIKDDLAHGFKTRKAPGCVLAQCRGCARVITIPLRVQLRNRSLADALAHLVRCPRP